MSMITLPVPVVARARDLFVLYSNKSAFNLEEYADVGSIYKQILQALQTEEKTCELEDTHVKYIISAINVCASRTPVEIQNYKPIAELLEILSQALKPSSEEETKTEL